MNCEDIRERIDDYLDETLSPSEQKNYQAHLADCVDCREALQRESHLSEWLRNGFEQAVGHATLDHVDRRRIVAAMGRELPEHSHRPKTSFWTHIAAPIAAAVATLVASIWIGSQPMRFPPLAVKSSGDTDNREVRFRVSLSNGGYIFRKNGNQVIDALTSDTVFADGALVVAR